jgi:hypothetical protein
MATDLKVGTKLDVSGFNAGLRSMRAQAAKFQNVLTAAAQVGATFVGVGTAISAAYSAAAMAAGEYASMVGDAAVRTGVSTEQMSALGYAVVKTGGQFNDATEAMAMWKQRQSEFTSGVMRQSERYRAALRGIGLDAKALTQMGLEDQILAVADAMERTQDQGARLSAASQLFGGNKAFLEFLQEGRTGIRQLMIDASRSGVVISKQQAEAGERLTRAAAGLKLSTTGALVNLADVAGMETILTQLTRLVEELGKSEGLRQLVFQLGVTGKDFLAGLNQALPQISQTAADLAELLRQWNATGAARLAADVGGFAVKEQGVRARAVRGVLGWAGTVGGEVERIGAALDPMQALRYLQEIATNTKQGNL